MANGYFPLVAPNPGGPLNFEPVNNALMQFQNTRFKNQQLGMDEQRNALMVNADQRAAEDQGWQRTNHQNALMDRSRTEFGRVAQAVDQEQDPTRRQAMFEAARTVDPRFKQGPYSNPNTGPRLAVAQAGLLPDPSKTEYGKTGTIVENPDGSYSTVMYRSNGEVKVQPLPAGATPARGVAEVDTGTGTQIISKSTGRPVREVPKDLAGAERQKFIGQDSGKAQAALPTVLNAADRMLNSIDAIDQDPGLDKVTGLVGGRIPKSVQFEGMADTQSKIDQLGGQTFLQAYNDLRGAGQISEREGIAAQAAYNRLTTQTMGTQAYRQALREFRTEVVKLAQLAKQRAKSASQVQTNNGPAPKQMGPAIDAGIPAFRGEQSQTAVNPQTGHKIMWDGSRWVDAQ